MTAQVADRVLLDGSDFAIVGVAGTGLFDPTDHGIKPVMISTACWRGFICTYSVVEQHLVLSRLGLGQASEYGGAKLDEATTLFGVRATTKGAFDEYVFDGIDIDVRFSGGLLLGRDFIRELYVHMGFHPGWKYREVREALFDHGELTRLVDRSEDVANVRAAVMAGARPDPDGGRDDLRRWVERTFELDYSRTFGP